ncbi:hypothetical protein EBQ81_03870 [bacterium]|nr:hypothetical protein [bacterium]NBX97973.1 hypothetical protein [bacterium]NDC94423.1 hypothetical protein [bacterium]
MSERLVPDIRTYPIGQYYGAIADVAIDPREYLKLEKYDQETGTSANWTTNKDAATVAEILSKTLPLNTEVEVWHTDSKGIFTLQDIDGIAEAASGDKAIRVTFAVEPEALTFGGLFVAWRIIDDRHASPYQLGALETAGSLQVARTLIQDTGTSGIVSNIDLLDTLLVELEAIAS